MKTFFQHWNYVHCNLYLCSDIEKAMENLDAKKEGLALQETFAKTKLNEA